MPQRSKAPTLFLSIHDPSLKTTNSTRGTPIISVCRGVRNQPARERPGEIERRSRWLCRGRRGSPARGLVARLLLIAVLALTVQSRFSNRTYYDFKAAGYNNDLQSYTYVRRRRRLRRRRVETQLNDY